MAILFARCPRTHRLIDTRVSVDDETLAETATQKAAVVCDYCDDLHIMRIGDMFCSPEKGDEAA